LFRNEKKEDAIKMIYEQLGTSVETIETIPAVFAVIDLAQGNPMEAAKISANIGWGY
jgi:ADP-ribosylglycohydrolase